MFREKRKWNLISTFLESGKNLSILYENEAKKDHRYTLRFFLVIMKTLIALKQIYDIFVNYLQY